MRYAVLCIAQLQGWPELYIYTPYMTVYMVISLPKKSYIHRLPVYVILANPTQLLSLHVLVKRTHSCSGKSTALSVGLDLLN